MEGDLTNNQLNYIDLFAGAAGFALGAVWAGIKVDNHFCSEVDPDMVELYKLRFPDSIQLGDITKIDTDKLKRDYPGRWILTGGFPCQNISIAGKGEGIIHGEKSNLWFAYWRIIRDLRAEFAIIENVSALVGWFDCERRPTPPENYNEGDEWSMEIEQYQGIAEVTRNLAEIGYSCEWQNISASDMGAPHKREREWIVAYPSGTGVGNISEQTESDRGRNAGRFEPSFRQGDGKDGTDRIEPTGETFELADPNMPRNRASEIGINRIGETEEQECRNQSFNESGRHCAKLADSGIPGSQGSEQQGSCGEELNRENAHGSTPECSETPESVADSHKQHGDITGYGASNVCRERPQETKIQGCDTNPGNFWADCDYIRCSDGSLRPVKPGIPLLASGIPRRMAKLRAAGNSILPQIAEILWLRIKPFL